MREYTMQSVASPDPPPKKCFLLTLCPGFSPAQKHTFAQGSQRYQGVNTPRRGFWSRWVSPPSFSVLRADTSEACSIPVLSNRPVM